MQKPSVPSAAQRTLGRGKMLLVLLACAAPVIASYITYYFIRPEGRTNFGALIEPQIVLPADTNLGLRNLQNEPISAQDVRGNWLLLTSHGGPCEKACTDKLYWMRQLRTALGKDKSRVDRVLLLTGTEPLDTLTLREYEGSYILRLAPQNLASWLPQATDALYLMDPQGNVVMRWPVALNLESAAKLKKDLTKLIRASVHWHKEKSPRIKAAGET